MKKQIVRALLAAASVAIFCGWSFLDSPVLAQHGEERGGPPEIIQGQLQVVADCEEATGRTLYYGDLGNERLELTFNSEPQGKLRTGMHFTVKGNRRGGQFQADEKSLTTSSGDELAGPTGGDMLAPVAGAIGEIKVLVMLINFQDNATSRPYTVDQANNLLFNQSNGSSVTNYYREASYGQTWVTGTTVGWYTLPMTSGQCDANSTIATYAKQAATAAGVNLAAYDKYMYVFPSMGCSYTGRGEVSGKQTWIDGSLILRTTAHELGHNLGLYHSKAMNCADVITTNCTTTEYGHSSDMIGQTNMTGHFHPFQKERLGWLNYGSSPPVHTVQSSGNYTVGGLSVQDNNPKALKIQKSSGVWYYVEFRRPVGFDSFVSGNSSTMNGVLVTMDTEASPASNYLLDMVPSTTSWSDSALTVGRSFTDPGSNMTITVVSVSPSGAVVNVSYGAVPCLFAAPAFSANPAATQWLKPGGSVNYTVTVTNNNSSSCTANSFNLQATLPAGWSVSSATPTLTVAPGSSASASVQVTSPVGGANGLYTGVLAAANAQSEAYSASVSRSMAILSSLGVTAATGLASYFSSQTVVMTANVSANGSPVAGASVTFTIAKPNGRSTSATAVTASNGIATYSYRLNKKQDPVGTYTVTAASNLNGISGSGSTNFVVR